ncbi:hypothetical protein DFH27DRAFT_541123 [Peziza echinospora]|nr:hypothetical protein DFH27DRAFT_541123 [Peziza echinospora]
MAFPHRYNNSTGRGSIDNDADSFSKSYSPFLKPHRSRPGSLPSPTSPDHGIGLDESNIISPAPQRQFHTTNITTAKGIRDREGSFSGNLLGGFPPPTNNEPWHQMSLSRQAPHQHQHQQGSSMFLPPPAVTSYAYAQTKSLYETQRSPLYSIQQKVKAYTAELQSLLDAQSAGLLKASQSAGVRGNDGDGRGSSLERLPSWDGGVTSSVLSPKKKPQVSLVAARHGILQAMIALANVKESEEGVYSAEEAERLKNISQVEGWERQKQELSEGIRHAKEGDEARRIVELRKEREAVELEIRQVEAHLRKLNSHHSSLLSKISTMESALSSKSSSYKSSLATITASESRFFSALPSNIRSPQLAIESWKAEADALRMKREQARDEVNALREGVIDWEEAVILISNFEKNLRMQMNPARKSAGTSGSKSLQLGKTSKSSRKDSQSLFGMSSMVSSQNPHGDVLPSSRSTYLNKNKSQIISSSSPNSGSASMVQGQGQGQGNSKRNPGLKRFDSLLNESDHEDGSVPEHLFSRAPSGFLPPRPQELQQQPESLEQKILVAIEDVLEKLEDKVANAESKNWNLLVCCLAAEAQAFREAREIILRRLAEMEQQERMKKQEEEARHHTQGLLSDNDDMELKSKFGRMEIGKGKQGGGGAGAGGVIGTGIDYANMAGFDDGHTPNWDSTTRDFGTNLDAILEDNKPEFFPKDLDASSGHGGGGHTTSSSISPKTPSRRNSTSGRSRNVRKIKHGTSIDEDGNAWDREGGGFDGGIDEDDSSTIRGASSMQFLKGPTVGQVMRGQGTSASVTHAPSGISIGLGTWGRLKKAGMGEHIHSGASSGWDSDPGVRGSSSGAGGGGGGETRPTGGGNDGEENLIIG